MVAGVVAREQADDFRGADLRAQGFPPGALRMLASPAGGGDLTGSCHQSLPGP